MNCRFCNTLLEHQLINLNYTPPANGYLSDVKQFSTEPSILLQVYVCSECFLVQLNRNMDPAEIFNQHYAYISSVSQTWKAHCKNFVEDIIPYLDLNAESLVVEVGSNDGTLIENFLPHQVPVLGIDPAGMASALTIDKKIPVIVDFFNQALANKLVSEGRQCDLLIGNNVMAHVPDINDFVKAIAILLKPEGICTIEFPYLFNLLRYNEFDTIYHEHFFYFSLTAVQKIVSHHKLELFKVEEINIHGGSLRMYLQHAGSNRFPVEEKVTAMLSAEEKAGIKTLNFYSGLQESADNIKEVFLQWLQKVKSENQKIMAYGAAAKGNTFLNYCGITSNDIPYIADITPEKCGKFLPGSHIPVVEEDFIQTYKPDYIIVLPWNFKDEIVSRLEYTRQWGCKLVFFIPSFELVN